MSWCRLEDTADENRKLRRLSHEAYRLYWSSVTYSRRHKLGGRMHVDDLQVVAGQQHIRNLKSAITDLVYVPREYGYEFGCFEEVGAGLYQIHDHEEYNPPTSKERMRRKRERDRAEGDGEGPDDGGVVTSHAVTSDVTSDVTGNGAVTSPAVTLSVRRDVTEASRPRHGDTPRAQERAGIPIPVPEPIPVTTGLRPSVPPPAPPGESGEVERLLDPVIEQRYAAIKTAVEDPDQGIWGRPVAARQWPMLRHWAELRRHGELVELDEILECARRRMTAPTRDGTPPSSLARADESVMGLALQPLAARSSGRGGGRRGRESAHDRVSALLAAADESPPSGRFAVAGGAP